MIIESGICKLALVILADNKCFKETLNNSLYQRHIDAVFIVNY